MSPKATAIARSTPCARSNARHTKQHPDRVARIPKARSVARSSAFRATQRPSDKATRAVRNSSSPKATVTRSSACRATQRPSRRAALPKATPPEATPGARIARVSKATAIARSSTCHARRRAVTRSNACARVARGPKAVARSSTFALDATPVIRSNARRPELRVAESKRPPEQRLSPDATPGPQSTSEKQRPSPEAAPVVRSNARHTKQHPARGVQRACPKQPSPATPIARRNARPVTQCPAPKQRRRPKQHLSRRSNTRLAKQRPSPQ